MAAVTRPRLVRSLVLALAGTAVAATLAGCVPTPEAAPGATDTSTPAPSATATDAPTTAPTDEAMPIDIDCADLVSADAVYAFDPNLALVGPFDPAAGTDAATDVAADGVACQWVRESGGATMEVSAGHYSDARLAELKSEAAAAGQEVPTYGDVAYFSTPDGVGTAIVFSGGYRLIVTSEEFSEPGEPTDIIQSALDALRAG